jgi:hypothetical protein
MNGSEIPDSRIKAYLKTEYRFTAGPGAVTLRIGRRSEELWRIYLRYGLACGATITAYNPHGRLRSMGANDAANRRLGGALRSLCRSVFGGTNTEPSGAWPEEQSYFALGVKRDAARTMGIRYHQDAIVWVSADAVPRLLLLR